MSNELPEHPSLDYLKRRAKERLVELRASDPRTKLAAAQLAIARDYGFASWRALKAEVDRRRAPMLEAFFAACGAGDLAAVAAALAREPALVHEREAGDNATPLHWAGSVEVARALLDAGADVNAHGDAHQLDVIGWHACFERDLDRDMIELLRARGARHHVFSAIACSDLDALQQLVEDDPAALARRMSRFEGGQSALHYVIAPSDGLVGGGFRTGGHYATLDLLLELGADVEATDDRGRTPLAVATLRRDREAMARLQAAGARVLSPPSRLPELGSLPASVTRLDVMLRVPDVRATIEWYRAIGFTLEGQHELDTPSAWAGLSIGDCYLMLIPGGTPGAARETSLWLRTERLEELYEVLKHREGVRFQQDLYDTFYGQREFAIVDNNGYHLTFCRSLR